MPSTSYERRKHNRKGWIFGGVGGTKLCQECAISERTKRVLRLQSYEHLLICMLIYENTKRVVIFVSRTLRLSFCSLCLLSVPLSLILLHSLLCIFSIFHNVHRILVCWMYECQVLYFFESMYIKYKRKIVWKTLFRRIIYKYMGKWYKSRGMSGSVVCHTKYNPILSTNNFFFVATIFFYFRHLLLFSLKKMVFQFSESQQINHISITPIWSDSVLSFTIMYNENDYYLQQIKYEYSTQRLYKASRVLKSDEHEWALWLEVR